MNYVYGQNYLKKVCVLLENGEYLEPMINPLKRLTQKGIFCEAMLSEEEFEAAEGCLYITDDAVVLEALLSQKLPVAAYLHEGNRGKDMSGAKYAFEEPEDLEPIYFERVYRRYLGVPWDILETERCYLRETGVEDVEAFYEIYKEPEMTRYTEALYESKISERAYVREYIEKVYSYFEFGIWTVILKETGEIIGRAGLNVREGYDMPELGYVIGRPWQKKGIATEICQAILEYARIEHGMEKVMTIIHKENTVSARLAEKLGFRYKENIWLNNKEYELLMFDNSEV